MDFLYVQIIQLNYIMSLIPKIKSCPCCKSLNLFRVNGISYENFFYSMAEWKLDRKFNCRKCKTEIGFFTHNDNQQEKTVWIDMLKCEDPYYKYLKSLRESNNKLKNNNKKYYENLHEINEIEKKIKLDKIKVKIKSKITNKGMFIRHVY